MVFLLLEGINVAAKHHIQGMSLRPAFVDPGLGGPLCRFRLMQGQSPESAGEAGSLSLSQ